MAKIIGIDPGLAGTGIGTVKGSGLKVEKYSYGSINTSKSLSVPNRLDQIFSQLNKILELEKPDLMVVEDVFFLKKYPKSGLSLGRVTGVVLLAGYRAKIPIEEIPVREAKKVLTGNGSANKSQLEKAVRSILKRSKQIKPFHVSDALGLALIGLFRYKNIS